MIIIKSIKVEEIQSDSEGLKGTPNLVWVTGSAVKEGFPEEEVLPTLNKGWHITGKREDSP